jgi:hypothetical protein
MRCVLIALTLLWCLPFCTVSAVAQTRVTPEKAKGGLEFGAPWADVPETFRDLKIPDWPVPTDLPRWQAVDRPQTRQTVLQLLGELPPRPAPSHVKVVSRTEYDDYVLERIEFLKEGLSAQSEE